VYVRDPGGEVVGGPYGVERFEPADVALPIYRTHVDVPSAGHLEVVAVTDGEVGTHTVEAVDPADSAIPTPGSEAVRTSTPTVEEPGDVVELCTLAEDCSMHEVSLDEALDAGTPVMLMFATPAYCQTAVCGPGVETLQGVKASRDWGDVAFIHAEIYTDEGQTVAEHVRAWDLPSEPWLFTIDRSGQIVARLDGPMIDEELAALAEELV
jgi:hypothetical protein